MNVTTEKSKSDPKQRIRQLEVAIEHAVAAATASIPNAVAKNSVSSGMVEVRYPSFEFRETLKALRPSTGVDGIWIVIDIGDTATVEACKAACTVLQHYFPDEAFVVSPAPVMLAS